MDEEIERIVIERKIKFLVHFTRIENLNDILENGLLPRNRLDELGIKPLINDELRLDGFLNATSLSIRNPNYKMFWKSRCEASEKQAVPHENWVVLGLKPDVLWTMDCAFCVTNAANISVTDVQVDDRKSAEALSRMFDEVEGKPTREKMLLKGYCTTDPQAEVLFFDEIEPEFILGAAFKTKARIDEFREKFPEKKFIHFPKLFSPREDYNYWS